MSEVAEIIARGIATAKGTKICSDATYEHSSFGALAKAAIAALTEAGYAIVPREPTPQMIAEAWKAISSEKRLLGIAKLGPGPAGCEVYRAMLATGAAV